MDDSEDLEALFDSIVQAGHATPEPEPVAASTAAPQAGGNNVVSQLGQMTRSLYDALHELGIDKSLERVAGSMPDATDRLTYIANLTQKAAERVLNATDIARPIQEKLEDEAKTLSEQWKKLYDNELSVEDFRKLAGQTREYLDSIPANIKATNNQLTEIMMAQDFQDLTGQVIKKVLDIVHSVEAQLVGLLIENSPKAEIPNGLLNGPVIKADGRIDVVTNQEQVDELLESLGF